MGEDEKEVVSEDVDGNDGRLWKERFHVMEKRQERMEKLLQQLLVKESDDRG